MATKKLILRSLAVILGISFVVIGSLLIYSPINGGVSELLSSITKVILGLFFIFYGVTGFSSVYKFIKLRNKQ